ncbi:uncharacterized protein METZ01_LOCUS507016, partial [marine metagenome]
MEEESAAAEAATEVGQDENDSKLG